MLMTLKMHFCSCALIALLLAVASADHHLHHNRGSGDHMSCHKLSAPNADFAFALYKRLNARTAAGNNIFFSPLGISTALSVLSTGAHSETHSQLFSSLGYSTLNRTQVNEAYQHLFHVLGQSQENQKLDVGNTIAVHSGFSPLEKFLNDVKQHYSGEVLQINFTNPAEAADKINRHIGNKTQDKIKDMVNDVDRETMMMLINYVYFKGYWKKPFNSEMTHKADFHVDSRTKVEVDMMVRTGYYHIFEDRANHTSIILLPYKSHTSMMIVLPDEGWMRSVEENINKDHIRNWQNSASMMYVELYMPKFSIATNASLRDILQEMGITSAFENTADFSAVSNKFPLKVSKASHKATISVTEMGTEAAAITISEWIPLTTPTPVRIDRPFLVFIVENSTGSILFMGRINKPTAS
ncbi:alpha-1-antitrypsin homolog [Simochromis diagramma]|uniref:alpha-1-antitrypsin homolog n=1 Tax=Simochromis diagramma TaxID=43689 RepID=UPI001A7E2E7E|nr:alpha-1-antitrypsin homolog [Simochromis diagramma]